MQPKLNARTNRRNQLLTPAHQASQHPRLHEPAATTRSTRPATPEARQPTRPAAFPEL